MEDVNKVIVIGATEFLNLLEPLFYRLDKMESIMLNTGASGRSLIYSEFEASKFLKVSTKKLQLLRNARKISFIREDGGRRVLYKSEHLLEYLDKHELKRKK